MANNRQASTDFAPALRDSIKSVVASSDKLIENVSLIYALDEIQESLLILNDKRQIIYSNKVFLNLLQLTKEDILGKRPGEAVHCVNANIHQGGCGTSSLCQNCGAVRSILEALDGHSNTKECLIHTNNHGKNTTLNLKVKASPYRIDDNSFTLFSITDISHIKKAETYENTFYQLFQNIHVGVAIYQKIDDENDFNIKFFNHAAEVIEHITSDEVINQKLTAIFPGVKKIGLLDVFLKVNKTGDPINHPIKFYKDNRITGWRENYVLKLPTGEVVAIYEDVTEEKQAEEKLIELNKWVNQIINIMQVGIVIINQTDHRIEEVNPKAAAMIGLPAEEIIGNLCHNFICPANCGTCPITDLGQEVDNSEKILINTKGESIPILKTVSKGIYNDTPYLIESFIDISSQKQLEHQLEHMSLMDSLTHIGNRRSMYLELDKEMSSSHRNNHNLSILMIDIDYFKKYNDYYGHIQGDECLFQVAKSLESSISRPRDSVFRYGGEEFLILLPETDLSGCIHVANRIIANFEALKIEHSASKVASYVTVSIGGCIYTPQDDISNKEVLAKADTNLYKAKNLGRNQVIL